jgi:hypothetical protein
MGELSLHVPFWLGEGRIADFPGQVTYFKKWRVQEMQKKARIKELEAQGAIKMEVSSNFTERS